MKVIDTRTLRRIAIRMARIDRRHEWLRTGLWAIGITLFFGGVAVRGFGSTESRLSAAAEAAAISAAAARDPALADLRVADALAAAGLGTEIGVAVARGHIDSGRFVTDHAGPSVRVDLDAPMPVPGAIARLLPRMRASAAAIPLPSATLDIGPRQGPPTTLTLRLIAALLGAGDADLSETPAPLDAMIRPADVAAALGDLVVDDGATIGPARVIEALADLLPADRDADRAALEAVAAALANSPLTVDPRDIVDPESAASLEPVATIDILAALLRAATGDRPVTVVLDRPADGIRALDVTLSRRDPPLSAPSKLEGKGASVQVPGLSLGLVASMETADLPGGAALTVPLEILVAPTSVRFRDADCGAVPHATIAVDPPGLLARFVADPGTGTPADPLPAILLDGPSGVARVTGRTTLAGDVATDHDLTAGATGPDSMVHVRPSIGLDDLLARLATIAPITVAPRGDGKVAPANLRNHAATAIRQALPLLTGAANDLLRLEGVIPGGADVRLTRLDCGDVRLADLATP